MSEEPARKSHAMAWTLLLVAMPLLWLLSVPWVAAYRGANGLDPLGGVFDPRSSAFKSYYAPWIWLKRTHHFDKQMEDYLEWCDGVGPVDWDYWVPELSK